MNGHSTNGGPGRPVPREVLTTVVRGTQEWMFPGFDHTALTKAVVDRLIETGLVTVTQARRPTLTAADAITTELLIAIGELVLVTEAAILTDWLPDGTQPSEEHRHLAHLAALTAARTAAQHGWRPGR